MSARRRRRRLRYQYWHWYRVSYLYLCWLLLLWHQLCMLLCSRTAPLCETLGAALPFWLAG